MKIELISIDEPESLNSDDADQGFKSVLKETMNDVKFVKEIKRMSSIHKDKKRKVKKKEPDNLCFSSFQASSNLQFNADRAPTNDKVSIGGELSLQGLSDNARLGKYNKVLLGNTRVQREGFQTESNLRFNVDRAPTNNKVNMEGKLSPQGLSDNAYNKALPGNTRVQREGFQTESNLRFNADRAPTNNKVNMEGKLSSQGLSDNVRLGKCNEALPYNTQIQQEDFQTEDVSQYIHIFSDIVKENPLSLPYKFQQGLQYLSMVSSERIVNSYVPKNNQIKGAQDSNHCDRVVIGARFAAVEVSVGPMFKNTGYKSNSLCSNIDNFDNSTGWIQDSLLNESRKYTYLANLKNSPADAFYRNPVARNYRVFFKGMRYLFKISGDKAWFNEGGEDDCS
ncbi:MULTISPECIES: hypothetical protein [Photorhabdus]|uniref:Uncharacterized protein n=2 Tax=Photorhabdus asymbiotica TaxID=291112 RepID=C7BJN0_PHOAA|nr:hypothetical protein [Photorhabdus asymbiotica]RKS59417.1 hypothetical protein BDD30_1488 [Photorhabdus asymbiotica]CAQ85555.1 Hypothetical protein PAU_03467 [Photorhabdus asymbiotica]